MKYLVIVNDGHGMETAGKRTPIFPAGSEYAGQFMHENEFNREVVRLLGEELVRCGIEVFFTAPEDTDVPLITRTNRANKAYADFCAKYGKTNVKCIYFGVHANANTGVWGEWGGISSHIYAKGGEAEKLANICQKYLLGGTPLRNRGVLVNNFHEVRETVMPAVLFECAFMDNLKEATLLKSASYRKECATEIAKGACEYLGLAYVPQVTPITKSDAQLLAEAVAGVKIAGEAVITDVAYWTSVLAGKITPNPEYLKVIFSRVAKLK